MLECLLAGCSQCCQYPAAVHCKRDNVRPTQTTSENPSSYAALGRLSCHRIFAAWLFMQVTQWMQDPAAAMYGQTRFTNKWLHEVHSMQGLHACNLKHHANAMMTCNIPQLYFLSCWSRSLAAFVGRLAQSCLIWLCQRCRGSCQLSCLLGCMWPARCCTL